MASLPSYQDAVSADWLHLVAPYISHQDVPSLCRVNRRFWETFAPRIWSTIPRSDKITDGDSEDGEFRVCHDSSNDLMVLFYKSQANVMPLDLAWLFDSVLISSAGHALKREVSFESLMLGLLRAPILSIWVAT